MPSPTLFWRCLVVATLLRVAAALALPLTLNEPYYWLWARHPALGYYDHPPLVAWLTVPFVPLGPTPLAVRAVALICATLCAALVYRYTRRLTGSDAAAAVAGLALLAAPYYTVMSVLAWPECGLLAAWAATLLTWHDAIFDSRDEGTAQRWLIAGVALGACLLAKFTSFACVFGIALFFATAPRARARWLATPWPWVALAAALAVYSPFLAWNATHDWQTFLFQAAERSRSARALHLGHVPKLFLETLAGLSPFVAVAMLPAAGDALRRAFASEDGEPLRLPLLISLPPLLGFALLSPVANVQMYWTLCCYLGLFPFLGTWLAARLAGADGDRWRRRAKIGVVVAVVPMLLVVAAALVPEPLFSLAARPQGGSLTAARPQGGSLTEMYAYPGLPALLEHEAASTHSPQTTFFAAEDHRLASQIAVRQSRPVLMFSGSLRGLEYLRWEDPVAQTGHDCVLVLRKPLEVEGEGLHARLVAGFDAVGPAVAHVVTWNGYPAQTFYTVCCTGFHPERSPALVDPRR